MNKITIWILLLCSIALTGCTIEKSTRIYFSQCFDNDWESYNQMDEIEYIDNMFAEYQKRYWNCQFRERGNGDIMWCIGDEFYSFICDSNILITNPIR